MVDSSETGMEYKMDCVLFLWLFCPVGKCSGRCMECQLCKLTEAQNRREKRMNGALISEWVTWYIRGDSVFLELKFVGEALIGKWVRTAFLCVRASKGGQEDVERCARSLALWPKRQSWLGAHQLAWHWEWKGQLLVLMRPGWTNQLSQNVCRTGCLVGKWEWGRAWSFSLLLWRVIPPAVCLSQYPLWSTVLLASGGLSPRIYHPSLGGAGHTESGTKACISAVSLWQSCFPRQSYFLFLYVRLNNDICKPQLLVWRD